MLGTNLLIVISLYFLLETNEVKCVRSPIPISESTWARSRAPLTIPTEDQLYGFVCPQPYGYHPVSTRCDAYIECKNNIPIQYKCPYGLYYSPNTQWPNFPCNYPWMESQNIRCRRSLFDRPQLRPESRNWLRSPPPSLPGSTLTETNTPAKVLYDYYCQTPNGYYPVSMRCDAYIECKDYTAIQYKCPTGLYYTSDVQWPNIPCNYPWLVFQNGRCGGIPIAKPETTPTHELMSTSPTMIASTPQPILPNTSTTNLIIVYPENYLPITTSKPLPLRPTEFWKPCWQNLASDPKCATTKPFSETIRTFVSPNEKSMPWYSEGVVAPNELPTLGPHSESMVGITAAPIKVIKSEISLGSTQRPPIQLFNYPCQDTNGFYSTSARCEAYVECKNRTAIQYECPEGLYFDPTTQWPDFPCNYPSKVQCENVTENDNLKLTVECPQRNGYFPMDSGSDCEKYIMCEEGRAIVMDCPTGLAFNFNTSSCDWPVNVPGCMPNAFKDFTCPPPPIDSDDDAIYKYRYKESCRRYVACQKGRPRLLSCDSGLSFDEKTETCVDAKLVLNCIV